MPFYLLIPQFTESEEWSASKHYGPVQVEAPNPQIAREIATWRFRKPARLVPGMVTVYLPWMSSRLCHIAVLEKPDPRYPIVLNRNFPQFDILSEKSPRDSRRDEPDV